MLDKSFLTLLSIAGQTGFHDNQINCVSLQNIRRYVVSWIFVVVLIVVVQLMVLFDVIHVVNTKSPEASDKSFLYTALEVFCLGEIEKSFKQI